MVLETKAGSFVLNTGTGNQTISGVGFQPDAILFFASGSTVEGTSAVDARYSYGMTDGTNDWVSAVTAEDGVATHTERVQDTSEIINLMNPASATVDIIVTHVSMNSDGFIINVGTNTNSEAILVKYFALGGLVNVVVGQVLASALAVSGLGFQPNLLFAMCSGQTAGDNTSMHALHGCFGCAERFSASTREWRHVGFFGEDDRAACSNSVLNDGFVGQVYNNATTWESTLTTFDTGGFTWTGSNPDEFGYMAIELPSGIEAFVGTFAKSSGGAPATQTLPNSTFTPQSYILCNGHDTSLTVPTAQSALHSIGAYSQEGTPTQFNVSVASEIAAGSQADCRADATNVVIETALGGGTVASAVPQTIDDSTPDIIWNPNTSATDFIGYLAFEEDPLAAIIKEIDETVQRSEGIVAHRDLSRADIDTVQRTEDTVVHRDLTREDIDTVQRSEEIDKALARTKLIPETIQKIENILIRRGLSRHNNETEQRIENIVVSRAIGKFIPETVARSEEVLTSRGRVKFADEIEQRIENIIVSRNLTREITDAVERAEALTVHRDLVRFLSRSGPC